MVSGFQNLIFALLLVETKTQYQNIKPEIDAAVIAVMESSQFIGG